MKYRKKAVDVEAVQFTGENFAEVREFCGIHSQRRHAGDETWDIDTFCEVGTYTTPIRPDVLAELWVASHSAWFGVKKGEWVVKDLEGFYPCEPSVFLDLYILVYDRNYNDNNGPFTVIADECFTDGRVISYKGENYYKACDKFVYDRIGGGQSFCVKRIDHPGTIHESYDGTTRDESDMEVVADE